MVRKLLRSVREYKKHSILAPVFVIFEVIMEVVIPLLMANLIDFGIDDGNLEYIVKMGVVLVVFALISLIFGILSGRSAAIASAGFAKNLRKDMYYKVQNFSFSNIDKFSTASIVTRLTTDVTNVQNAYMMIIRVAVRAPIMLICALVLAFNVNSSMALIFLCIVPILAVGLFFIMSKAHPIFERVFKTYDKLNNVVQENLYGIRVVKSFVREDHENEKFGKISKSIFKDFSKAERLLAWNMPLMQFCVYTCMLLISWFGARLIVLSGNDSVVGMTTGQLMSLITYAMQILMSLMMLSMVFLQSARAMASIKRIDELMNTEVDLTDDQAGRKELEVKEGRIEFKDVSFSYDRNGEDKVLEHISFTAEPGQVVGIIGSTGSGKTSMVQLIPRLYDVTEGAVLVDGVDVREYSLKHLRNGVGMVLQKNVLFSGTIEENLRWGSETASEEDIRAAADAAQADSFVASFKDGYDTDMGQGGVNVSGGQKQRLCIARALLKKPKILILDDSTSAVDTATEAKIRESFHTTLKDTTKLIIAQRISSVEDADQILVLDDGHLIGVGTHRELLEHCEAYQEIYYSQRDKEGEASA